jgi:hypothetical protein
MRHELIVIAILGLIVALSGCTINTETNKTFSEDGINFTYPGDWEVLNDTAFGDVGNSSEVRAAVGIEGEEVFIIATPIIRTGEYLRSPTEWLTNVKSSLGSAYVSDKTFPVDGEEGILITSKDNGEYVYFLNWNKDGKGYIAAFRSQNESLDTFESIAKTIQTS